jgi:hypothetical protein
MKQTLKIAVLAVTLAVALLPVHSGTDPVRMLIIGSRHEGEEYRFECTYVVGDSDPEYRHFEGMTPWEILLGPGKELTVIVNALTGDADLDVRLVRRENGQEKRQSSATGRTIVLNNTDTHSSIRGYGPAR